MKIALVDLVMNTVLKAQSVHDVSFLTYCVYRHVNLILQWVEQRVPRSVGATAQTGRGTGFYTT